jgi:hypothetical protein
MTEVEFLGQAMWLAKHRSYKPSWCYVIFHQRYGKWPSKKLLGDEVLPVPPSDEFWDWLAEQWGRDAVLGIRDWLRAMWKDVA